MSESEKSSKSPLSMREEQILAFWDEKQIFEKSVEKPAGLDTPHGEFVFYDGPPFATGSPHYGHILAGTIKDAIPRYKTMQGYSVRRRWGWDCHGLPVENLIEKELGLKSKKDILTYGVEKFNDASRASVMRYADEWRKLVPRMGRFVDMENDYKTMDSTYTESVWWAFKKLHDKGLIYEGFKSMNLCPRCETTLSNFEVSQGYKDITDISVFVKFELVDEPGTFLVAWTTTPWTLPGNVALAVSANVEYVKVESMQSEGRPAEKYIVAKPRFEAVNKFMGEGSKIIETISGAKLVGRSYKPVFDYYFTDKSLKNRENGWKVYNADFVTTEDGTGIVHIAPAFGADDYTLSLSDKLPFIQHVSTDGKFKKEATDFVGQDVKPKGEPGEKDAHQRADIEIIKYLAHYGALLAKEKLIHSYPHCWRCDTPLLNYASSSWFVKVTDFKDKLVSANKKVKWVPSEVGEGRFGNWLSGARDWAISRSRFWGAPLPVWRDEKTGEIEVIGSVEDLKARSRAKNTYYVIRHGEAENNVKSILSTVANAPHHLTEKGKEQVKTSAMALKDHKIDLIFSSPFVRTDETAMIVANSLGISRNEENKRIFTDDRLHEINAGEYDGKSANEYHKFFEGADRFTKAPKGGENFQDVKKRVGDFIYDIESKYSGKNILIVTHDTPAWLLFSASYGLDEVGANKLRGTTEFFVKNAEVKKLDFVPLPHNKMYELDLHRPFIDDVVLTSRTGNRLVRVPEVFDCWFESGSMPYGEAHYPFEKDEFEPNPNWFKKMRGFPADFIAEGLDQTRGWFYSMLVLGVGLFGRSPFKQVIVNGLVLAEDGQKMAKSKKNYPDPMDVVNKYGADAMRYYLLSSPVVHGQDFCFIEKGVDEVVKKHIGRLNNVVTFYEMYADSVKEAKGKKQPTKNLLDEWILARTSELITEVTRAMNAYELDKATRPFADFIDDLSTWYIRRSRDRFKEGGEDTVMAIRTTRFVLITISKLLAPFMPFLAEDIYGKMRQESDPVSVHLTAWPKDKDVWVLSQKEIIPHMTSVRAISSLGLEARSKGKINVRQPLAKLSVKSTTALDSLSKIPELVNLIKDEVNVKEVMWIADLTNDVELDTVITPALKEEGQFRELVRAIQDLRKKENLTIKDMVSLSVSTDSESIVMIEKYKAEIIKTTGLRDLTSVTNEAKSDSAGFILSISR